jgi:deazaflavin-dependent oxidoreductase (nitroreductase family)
LAKQLGKLTTGDRLADAVMKAIARAGLGPKHMHVLTVPGRKTGRLYSTPVILVERHDTRYLVAPYGERAWVKNARAAGSVRLSRGRKDGHFAITQLAPHEAAPILREYVRSVPAPRSYFDATQQSGVEAFEAEAERHPVFELHPVGDAAQTRA